eukprot:365167-Chlamydomonas_euryale.AAC.4
MGACEAGEGACGRVSPVRRVSLTTRTCLALGAGGRAAVAPRRRSWRSPQARTVSTHVASIAPRTTPPPCGTEADTCQRASSAASASSRASNASPCVSSASGQGTCETASPDCKKQRHWPLGGGGKGLATYTQEQT